MARPPSITDEEVLAAARVVFLNKGITATVEEVAERCHVGVATIFRRFPTKQALFAAAMTIGNDTEWGRFLAKRAAAGDRDDARAALLELARQLLDTGRKMLPLMMMMMSNPSIEDKQSRVKRTQWVLKSLADYFALEIEAGHMLAVDPRVAARIWLGSIRQVVMFESLGPAADELSTESFIEGLVDMFCLPSTTPRKR
jgi:AcrR family transcriptional regulator